MPKCIHCDKDGNAYLEKDKDENGKCKYCNGTGYWKKDDPY